MAGYVKNIAVIRAIKGGFSVDGGALSGLVKAEKYGGFLRAEVVKINFAPLISGRYVAGISDGVRVALCSGDVFEGNSDMDISFGFAALICFVREGEVSPVATAVCGDYSWALARIQEEVERREGVPDSFRYEDDAIAEDNYYEYGDGAQSGGTVCEDSQQKERPRGREDEDDFGICKEQTAKLDLPRADGEDAAAVEDTGGAYAKKPHGEEECGEQVRPECPTGGEAEGEVAFHRLKVHGSDKNNGLGEGSGQNFYARMHAEIERLLSDYPREEKLEQTVQGSRWVRINYGGGRYYVFGVIYSGQSPAWVCYGVPSKNSSRPPSSLAGMASYIPAGRQGYWVMYQNALTGESVRLRQG